MSGSPERRGFTLAFSFGAWGGFYWRCGYTKRLCLGWFALTWIPRDLDPFLRDLAASGPASAPPPPETEP